MSALTAQQKCSLTEGERVTVTSPWTEVRMSAQSATARKAAAPEWSHASARRGILTSPS
jgi:hypothetical protein